MRALLGGRHRQQQQQQQQQQQPQQAAPPPPPPVEEPKQKVTAPTRAHSFTEARPRYRFVKDLGRGELVATLHSTIVRSHGCSRSVGCLAKALRRAAAPGPARHLPLGTRTWHPCRQLRPCHSGKGLRDEPACCHQADGGGSAMTQRSAAQSAEGTWRSCLGPLARGFPFGHCMQRAAARACAPARTHSKDNCTTHAVVRGHARPPCVRM
jgi:hypothetical protein